MTTVLPNFTARLVATGNASNFPSALSTARSLAGSTFTLSQRFSRATRPLFASNQGTFRLVTRNQDSLDHQIDKALRTFT